MLLAAAKLDPTSEARAATSGSLSGGASRITRGVEGDAVLLATVAVTVAVGVGVAQLTRSSAGKRNGIRRFLIAMIWIKFRK
jgi:hypothetical protein